MRKIIAAINMTLDGFCDHTAGLPDEKILQHYSELLGPADVILYGRTTYQAEKEIRRARKEKTPKHSYIINELKKQINKKIE